MRAFIALLLALSACSSKPTVDRELLHYYESTCFWNSDVPEQAAYYKQLCALGGRMRKAVDQ